MKRRVIAFAVGASVALAVSYPLAWAAGVPSWLAILAGLAASFAVGIFLRLPRTRPPQERHNGLSEDEFTRLAGYNAERARGVAHTPQWRAEMAALQQRYDAGGRERMIREGWTERPDGMWIKAGKR